MNDLKLSYIAVLLALALSAGSASELRARNVKGIVTCGDEKLSKVIVTDGKNFTRTNKNGSFKMDIADSAQFVYIITPSGYCADWSSGAPEFYRKADGKDFFEFDLIKTGDPRYRLDYRRRGKPGDEKRKQIIKNQKEKQKENYLCGIAPRQLVKIGYGQKRADIN